MLKKSILLSLLWVVCASLSADENYRTQSFTQSIKSLQIKVNSNPLALPIVELKSNEYLDFFFDEMSHEGHSYSYQIVHCNADWTESDLATSEYIDGFSSGYIDDSELSVNTTFLYTNYHFRLPNNNTEFLLSGNYAVKVFEDNDEDNPICTFTFSVLDSKVGIEGKVRTNTNKEINGRFQQVDFDILNNAYPIQDVSSELKIVVKQNNRTDNMVTDIEPTYFSANKLSYKNSAKLIFEAGNEYRRFDISSRQNYDQRVDKIEFINPHFNAFLKENWTRNNQVWQTDQDVNGKFIINFESSYNGSVEADYYYVHFSLNSDDFLPKGSIYIGGNWNDNQLNETSKMEYDTQKGIYTKTLLLKQGAYNYLYWFLPSNSPKATLSFTEGNYWQTENEYVIYVYHRPFGARYDKLIGVKIL